MVLFVRRGFFTIVGLLTFPANFGEDRLRFAGTTGLDVYLLALLDDHGLVGVDLEVGRRRILVFDFEHA